MASLRQASIATPDKTACIVAETGEALTFAALERRCNQTANLLQGLGVTAGETIAVMLENDLRYCEIVLAARRLGLYYTPVSRHLRTDEVAHILRDSGAKVLFVSAALTGMVADCTAGPDAPRLIVLDGGTAERDYDRLREAEDDRFAMPDVPPGRDLCYSSGTTGRPKGILHPLRMEAAQERAIAGWIAPFGFAADTVYLSPAPLYHAAPLRFVLRTIAAGGTAVVMKSFQAANALACIERFRVSHSQWVPTMFFRMLALPEAERRRYDLSSHRVAIHAAAPCPAEIKERMIAWWGPIVWEYYAGSERNGATLISSAEWLQHKGSVGRAALGSVHILGPDGQELAPGAIGDVYFDGPPFAYLNDPAKTAASHSDRGWSTIGDMGYLDADGYLHLTDRRAHTIISGGVNIYPAEIENVLALHPAVADVGVFGIPDPEFGEEVKAAVQLVDPAAAGRAMERDLIAFCRQRLAGVKCPRSVDFHDRLPRQENGKLYKQQLRAPYLAAAKAAAS